MPLAPLTQTPVLTPQQARACDLLIQDMGDKEIAVAMSISVRTVQDYIESARYAFGSRSRVGLAVRWFEYRHRNFPGMTTR